ncbi:hypothetical protein BDA99DRAFT_438569 [Phascolomyces articulosus]|uniref:Uncharacterized protein n=1 Tax=Phascolomyces articulosus TaxID=60185 RepID=A0AAD5K9J3_9FUNG|nr:hypothetical protein BDA99DRAFT_438569 [Phascolomyces articulosus]
MTIQHDGMPHSIAFARLQLTTISSYRKASSGLSLLNRHHVQTLEQWIEENKPAFCKLLSFFNLCMDVKTNAFL